MRDLNISYTFHSEAESCRQTELSVALREVGERLHIQNVEMFCKEISELYKGDK